MEFSSPFVQLEIIQEWRVWKGYLLSGWEYGMNYQWNHTDLMDVVPEYDALQAFPSLKPDIDILLPPPRTRKQRGWYHLSRYIGSPLVAPPVRQRRNATGADIPPELIHLIGDHLSVDAFYTRNKMGAYTLVCRHWARVIQERMFEMLTIETHTRLLKFLRFLTEPISHIRTYVNILDLSYTLSSGAPFLHMLPRILRLLSAKAHTTIHLIGPLPVGLPTIRSIYSSLPRALPQTVSANVERLVLSNIHFQCFEDVAQLLCELPSLNHLQAQQLTWTTKAIPAGLSRKLQQYIALGRVLDCTATNCTQYWPLSWFCGLGLCTTDVCAQLSAIVGAIENSFEVLAQLHAVSYGPPEDSIVTEWHSDATAEPTFKLTFYLTASEDYPQLFLGPPAAKQIRHKNPADQHVLAMVAQCPPSSYAQFSKLDWSAVDRLAPALSSFRLLVMVFESEANLKAFADDGHCGKLKQLAEAGKVTYPDPKTHWLMSQHWAIRDLCYQPRSTRTQDDTR